ncbi:hypothetical protein GA0070560_106126 [Micromonospora halophytica]|uniref:Uncharacterized protein n=1 Tax=Micromonospora halophytica TaxID=47864 RepID=A0A1C5HVM8_9ACTN|nr:hypothetical protein GA0070560_106126 [Micromonospora halophytica]
MAGVAPREAPTAYGGKGTSPAERLKCRIWACLAPGDDGEGRERSVNHLAYLDAGSGSLIVQAVVGGVAGAAVAAKLYWRRLVDRFRRQPTDRG